MKGLPERCLAVDLSENDICDVMANGLRSPMAIAALRMASILEGTEARSRTGRRRLLESVSMQVSSD